MGSGCSSEGGVAHGEILQRTPVAEEMRHRGSMRKAFELIDQDGDNRVTKEEIAEAMVRAGMDPLSPEELIMLMQRIDVDGNGEVDMDEFSASSALRLQYIGQGLLQAGKLDKANQLKALAGQAKRRPSLARVGMRIATLTALASTGGSEKSSTPSASPPMERHSAPASTKAMPSCFTPHLNAKALCGSA